MTHDRPDHSPLLNPACVGCLMKKQMDRYPASATREQALTYIRRLGEMMATLPDRTGGPEILERITDIRAAVFGEAAREVEVDYAAIKTYYNRRMLELSEESGAAARIRAAADPLRAALGYAMTGNFIDFGAMDSVDEGKLGALLEDAPHRVAEDNPAYAALSAELATARRLTYLLDNCGEIVMDRLLIVLLLERYPHLSVTVLVRGAPVLNDVTLEDAHQVGLDRLEGVRVMSNGDRLAGTALGRISAEARAALEESDLILAKGQGNFETLLGCGLNIYYAFLCKCDLFARRFDVPIYTGMLVREKDAEQVAREDRP